MSTSDSKTDHRGLPRYRFTVVDTEMLWWEAGGWKYRVMVESATYWVVPFIPHFVREPIHFDGVAVDWTAQYPQPHWYKKEEREAEIKLLTTPISVRPIKFGHSPEHIKFVNGVQESILQKLDKEKGITDRHHTWPHRED